MKAYLSTGNDEDRRHRYNASAEFEAECILAETERTCAHSALSYWRDLPRTDERDHPLCLTRLRDALAGSLAAFLESEAFGG